MNELPKHELSGKAVVELSQQGCLTAYRLAKRLNVDSTECIQKILAPLIYSGVVRLTAAAFSNGSASIYYYVPSAYPDVMDNAKYGKPHPATLWAAARRRFPEVEHFYDPTKTLRPTITRKVDQKREELLTLIREQGPLSVAELCAHTDRGREAVSRHLHRLETDGLVRKFYRKTGGRGRPTAIWRAKGGENVDG